MSARIAFLLSPVGFASGYFNAMALVEGPDAAVAAARSLAWDVIVPTVRALDALTTSPIGIALEWIGYVGWTCVALLAVAVVAVNAWDAYAPRVMRAVGRHAFKVARAAYRAAR